MLSFLAVQTASQVKRGIPYLIGGQAESPRLSLYSWGARQTVGVLCSFASMDVSVNNTFCFLLLLLKKGVGGNNALSSHEINFFVIGLLFLTLC